MTHHTGFIVWQFGEQHWHRTYAGAYRRACEFWASDFAQIIEVATGKLVYGQRQ